jgi:hypothetical protein
MSETEFQITRTTRSLLYLTGVRPQARARHTLRVPDMTPVQKETKSLATHRGLRRSEGERTTRPTWLKIKSRLDLEKESFCWRESWSRITRNFNLNALENSVLWKISGHKIEELIMSCRQLRSWKLRKFNSLLVMNNHQINETGEDKKHAWEGRGVCTKLYQVTLKGGTALVTYTYMRR